MNGTQAYSDEAMIRLAGALKGLATAVVQSNQRIMAAVLKPKRAVYDKDGRVAGVEHVPDEGTSQWPA